MSLKERLVGDLKEAMKRGDTAVVSVLRMLLAPIHNKEIEKKTESLSDTEVQQVLATEARKRKESVLSYTQGDRPELARKEQEELVLIKTYLPKEASEEEIRKAVKEAIAKIGAASPKDFGKVMGMAMGSLKGKADGNVVQKIVKEVLD